MKFNPLDDLFKEKGQYIKVFLGKEIVQDPLEGNTTTTYYNPVPVKVLVTDLLPSQIQWKMPGIRTEKAKELVLKSNKRDLIELSHKIEIDGDDYIGWRDNSGKMQIENEDEYIRVKVYTRTNA